MSSVTRVTYNDSSQNDSKDENRNLCDNSNYKFICSPMPMWLGSTSFVNETSVQTVKGQKTFKSMIMIAVKPEYMRENTEDIWSVSNIMHIRPYAIAISVK